MDRGDRTSSRARWLLAAAWLLVATGVQAQERVVFRCPGNLYTDQITAKEATARGCKMLDGAPITVIASPPRRAAPAAAATGSAPADSRVEGQQQRQRDSDRRRILETELAREEERLAALQREYNNGEPERQGNERNFQKYQDRVAELKANVERSQSDVAALRREVAKLPPAGGGN